MASAPQSSTSQPSKATDARAHKPSVGEAQSVQPESAPFHMPHVTLPGLLAVAATLVIGFHVLKKLTKLFFQVLIVAGLLFGLAIVLTHFHLVAW